MGNKACNILGLRGLMDASVSAINKGM